MDQGRGLEAYTVGDIVEHISHGLGVVIFKDADVVNVQYRNRAPWSHYTYDRHWFNASWRQLWHRRAGSY